MRKLIRWLLGLCDHEYKLVEKGTTNITSDGYGRWTERYFISRCEKCGKHRKETFEY